ncbi:MAG TPA: alpha/beta hydrolase [Candidatus Angelobacter sp.]|nr:alpha/beta hydrolase [Candidatus Angelobacter sp.]
MRFTSLRLVIVFFVLAGSLLGQTKAKDAVAISEGYATIGAGVRIHYLRAGQSTSKRALILIPGWRLPAFLWEEQLKTFAPVMQVIAIDPRSQGESTKTPGDNTPESRAKDLHEVLGQMGISQPVLVGWSQGAQDVAAYLQEFGADSVSGVVFVDSPVSAGPSGVEANKEFSKAILANISLYARHPKEASEGMVHSIFKKPRPDAEYQKIVQSTLQTPTDTGIAMLVMDIFGMDRRPALEKLNKPALVIASAESPLVAAQKAMAASIPGAKFLAIEGTGHAVFVDEPGKFDAALQNFLQTLPE